MIVQQNTCGNRCKAFVQVAFTVMSFTFQLLVYSFLCLPLDLQREQVELEYCKAIVAGVLTILVIVCAVRLVWTDPGRVPSYLVILLKLNTQKVKRSQVETTERTCSMQGTEVFELDEQKHDITVSVDSQKLTKQTPLRHSTTNKPICNKPSDRLKRNSFKKANKQKDQQLQLENGHQHISEIIELPQTKTSEPAIDQFNLCGKCLCYLPPRAHHCKKCNRCILRRDHHCAWLGSCVGFYNHKFYILLLYYESTLLALMTSSVIQRLVEGPGRYEWVYVGFLILSIPELCLMIALCFFHTALLARNMTSLERTKHPNYNPYDLKNCKANIEQVFGPLSLAWMLPIAPNLEGDGTTFSIYVSQAEELFNPLNFAANID